MGVAIGVVLAAAAAVVPSFAQTNIDEFADRGDGAKTHKASGFVCPMKVGRFERDAVGQADPELGSVFCAYSARDGVYGTVVLKPNGGTYDARTSFAREFALQEGIGGRPVGETAIKVPAPQTPSIYARSYETAKLADVHYRILYAGAGIGSWAVEATVEYVEPRDTDAEKEFIDAVYAAAGAEIVARAPLAAGAAPR
jgi:hypothetical protein